MFLREDFSTAQEEGIVISAYQELLNERASNDEFCWGYYLRIENNSDDTISLLGQNISVTDMVGRRVSVDYDGFHGEAPVLEPGEVFEFEDYATSRTSAVLCGCCRIICERSQQVKEVHLPVLSLIANDNSYRILN